MARHAALEALALAQAQVGEGGQAGRDLVVAVLALVLAQARGCLAEVDGVLAELSAAPGQRWDRLASALEAIAERRGRGLIDAGTVAELRTRIDDATLGVLVDGLRGCHAAGPELLGTVYEAGRSGAQRRRDSTHYTPGVMATAIVTRAFEPLVGRRSAGELRVCDPAMGTGVFVLEACRQLGPRIAKGPEGRVSAAMQCAYGVDEDPDAVALARLSLWLECGVDGLPWASFDHNLRCADALVGLEREQLACLHWSPARAEALDWVAALIDEAEQAGETLRQALAAPLDGPAALERRARALFQHRAKIAPLAGLGDRVIAAFLSATKVREREAARERVVARQQRTVLDEAPRALHWWLALPELGVEGFDVVVGNPPFLGKNSLIAKRGRAYFDWLKLLHPNSHGNADYAAHFFRRAANLVKGAGAIGLVATNTIAQGDTRATGLAALVREGWRIHAAERDLEWPGAANVTVSIVHLERGESMAEVPALLNGCRVDAIDSRLRAGPERPEPARLAQNRGLAFIGTYLLGQGFVLDASERGALIAVRPANAERIRLYIGGGQLNRSPTQTSERHVIDFGARSEAEAERWPELLEWVRERVKPQRERLADNPDGRRRKRCWWQHGRVTPSLEAALAPLERCIVTSLVNKRPCFAFQPAGRLFSHKLCVFPFESAAALAVLQSRVHLAWAWLLSSTMRNAGINYSPSDCFGTFAFPAFDAELEQVGAELDERRARYMVARDQGLTRTYNDLADASKQGDELVALREAHEVVDRGVLRVYGWDDIEVPGYLGDTEAFERIVLDRLFALNAVQGEG